MYRRPSSSSGIEPFPDPSKYVSPSKGNRPKNLDFTQSCNSDSYYALEGSFYEIEDDEKDEFPNHFQVYYYLNSRFFKYSNHLNTRLV